MAHDLSPWIGGIFGVVDQRPTAGSIAFPGLEDKGPVVFHGASRFQIRGTPLDIFPILARVDITKNGDLPELNGGWEFCTLGAAGVELNEPIGKGTLPEWDPQTTAAEFSRWEKNLFDNLILDTAGGEKPSAAVLDSRTHLEGIVCFVEKRTLELHWERVRIFRVKNALQKAAPNGSRDWMAYKFSPLTGKEDPAQEGGGHGPPDLK